MLWLPVSWILGYGVLVSLVPWPFPLWGWATLAIPMSFPPLEYSSQLNEHNSPSGSPSAPSHTTWLGSSTVEVTFLWSYQVMRREGKQKWDEKIDSRGSSMEWISLKSNSIQLKATLSQPRFLVLERSYRSYKTATFPLKEHLLSNFFWKEWSISFLYHNLSGSSGKYGMETRVIISCTGKVKTGLSFFKGLEPHPWLLFWHTHAHINTHPLPFPQAHSPMKLKLAFVFIIHASSLFHSPKPSFLCSDWGHLLIGGLFYGRHKNTKINKSGEWLGDSVFGVLGWTFSNCQYWTVCDLHSGHFIWFSLMFFLRTHTYVGSHSSIEELLKTQILSLDLLFIILGNSSKL